VSQPSLIFLDSDLFVLHAGAGLLEEFITSTGCALSGARRLEPLPQMLKRGPMVRAYPEGVRQRAEAWCSVVRAVDRAPSPSTLDQLLSVAEIDPGEALLFAAAAEADSALVATGDRRACAALNAARGLDDVRAQLKGRVICLETSLQLLLERVGYLALVESLSAVRECNQTLRVLLPQGEATPERAFREGLESYARELASQIGDLRFTLG
jgi:hypothetical protein